MTSRPHALHLEPSQLFIREESGPDQNGAVLSSHLPEVDVLFCFCSRCWKFRALPVRKRGRDGRFKLNSPSWSWTDQSCIEVFFFFIYLGPAALVSGLVRNGPESARRVRNSGRFARCGFSWRTRVRSWDCRCWIYRMPDHHLNSRGVEEKRICVTSWLQIFT